MNAPATSRPLILGSTSVYRRELLSRLRLPFTVERPEVDETPLPQEKPADLALRLALQGVVADGGGGGEGFLQVAGLQPGVALLRMVRPQAGVAVGLQFLAHQQAAIAFDAFAALARLVHPRGDAGERLHVVADLVRDDVGLGEIAAAQAAKLAVIDAAYEASLAPEIG